MSDMEVFYGAFTKSDLALAYQCGVGSCGFRTVPENILPEKDNLLRVVYKNGEILVEDTFEQIRERAALREDEYITRELWRY